ncbi:MAG: crossover junction endodeoxyribonuclease RuvC [bacterium]|nr:crossover junction endodeoxyribonuclease RuvC [bacterium]
MPNLTVLGLDPGLATTGYGVVSKKDGVVRAVEWGIIATEKNKLIPERLYTISKDVARLIKRFHPQIAAVESIYFSKNVKTAIFVAQARGAILLTLQAHGVKILELSPSQLKSQITSYGSASKAQVQNMVKKLLLLKNTPRPDDAADALALAFCGTITQIH